MPNGKQTTFMLDVINGKATFDDIDDYIDAWHADPAGKGTLQEYLGFSDEEYTEYLRSSMTDDFKETLLLNHQYDDYRGPSESPEMVEYLDDMAEGACEGGR